MSMPERERERERESGREREGGRGRVRERERERGGEREIIGAKGGRKGTGAGMKMRGREANIAN